MLKIRLSNRLETLRDCLIAGLGEVPSSPFSPQHIVVPSAAMRRHLTLAIADRRGICANVECVYLAQWLWHQIAKVVRTVAFDSPFASNVLAWRIYQLLEDSAWTMSHPRLDNYLRQPSARLRFDLAVEVAALFEQYITHRQDWMTAWLRGESIPMREASASQVDDQNWQAELWRQISTQMGAEQEHPASRFFRCLERSADAGANPFGLPDTVHVFCLPAMPPLYLAVLTGIARWVDVILYVLNPCREYWFDIVDPKRLSTLTVHGAAAHHETGNRLLASWGRQTKAHIELLLDRTGNAPVEDVFVEDFPPTMLGRVQESILNLSELVPGSLASGSAALAEDDRSIEVHVCHSLMRELEVLHDQLLALFAEPAAPKPEEVLIVTPNLEVAAPLIEAVFGTVPEERRLPYAITGRGRASINAAARALLALLDVPSSRVPASTLLELLQQPLIGRRFRIAAEGLQKIQEWIQGSGIRWGVDAEHRLEHALPGMERFSINDGLDRLFLGYALPERVSAPVFGRIPAGNAEGSGAQTLGLFADFVEQLVRIREDFREPRLPDAWLPALLDAIDLFLAPEGDDVEAIGEVREALRELHGNMCRGGLATPLPLAVVRAGLETLLDDPARGGVPSGSITFSSMSSLRNLPFKVIGVIGLDDRAFPNSVPPREFDLMAALPRAGDRQRRADDRNVFLDLILAARERFYVSYTGRSIRDNGVLPPSVVVAELIEALLPAIAPEAGGAAALAAARRRLIVEHPLQAFAAEYFRAGSDPRRRSFNRELCEARSAALGSAAPVIDTWLDPSDDADDADDQHVARADRRGVRFFAAPLAAPGAEWRRVSLDQLLRFFRNPCDFLLRKRLGMSLFREELAASDDEPFVPDFRSRQALADRLLPHAMRGIDAQELRDLAQAGIEYPPGTLGSLLLEDEITLMQQFAQNVRDATQSPCLSPLSVVLPFVLDGEDWLLSTVLVERREAGMILHRYDDTRATDYLEGWLTHLVAGAAAPPAAVRPQWQDAGHTQWISRDGSFRFAPCADARAILEGLMGLYCRGLREPIHFFPKSAWEYCKSGRSLSKAREMWHPGNIYARGEDAHAAYRLALRGIADPLDADFQSCAEAVFGRALSHISDARLKVAQP